MSAQLAIAAPSDEARHDPMDVARAELGVALARVSAAYAAVPPESRDEIDFQDRALVAAVDAALVGDNPAHALAAVRSWENGWADRLRRFDRNDAIIAQIVGCAWDEPIPRGCCD